MNSYKNYIDLIRNILKNFDHNEFDDVIKNILPKVFDDYYINRFEKTYNIDNIFKKYDKNRYSLLKKKYKITQNNKLIFRFRKYNKQEFIIKLLKNNVHVFLEQNETYRSIAKDILKYPNIDCYVKFINEKYLYKPKYEPILKEDCKIDLNSKIVCFYPPCLKLAVNNNYCSFHNKDMI